MSNNKAYVKIPIEVIKYAPNSVHNKTAEVLNNIFEKQQDIDTGNGNLVPLQKPPSKTKGPVKNLRPINLLPPVRKILSKTGLKRSRKCNREISKQVANSIQNKKKCRRDSVGLPMAFS